MSLLVFLIFVVILVSALHPKYIHYVCSVALLSVVLLYTLVCFIDWHPIDLVSIFYYASAGIIIGGILFFVGSVVFVENPSEYFKQCMLGVRHTARIPLADIAYKIGLVSCEELIWRVFLIGALTQLLPFWLSIVIAAGLFWLAHEENRPLNDRSVEFFQFSLALSIMYAYTGSFALVWCAHMVRVVLTMSATLLVSKQNP